MVKMVGVGKDGRETCRSVSKDMDFIADTVRAKWASTSRIGDMLIRGTETSVSREGFTLGATTQEIGRVWGSGAPAPHSLPPGAPSASHEAFTPQGVFTSRT